MSSMYDPPFLIGRFPSQKCSNPRYETSVALHLGVPTSFPASHAAAPPASASRSGASGLGARFTAAPTSPPFGQGLSLPLRTWRATSATAPQTNAGWAGAAAGGGRGRCRGCCGGLHVRAYHAALLAAVATLLAAIVVGLVSRFPRRSPEKLGPGQDQDPLLRFPEPENHLGVRHRSRSPPSVAPHQRCLGAGARVLVAVLALTQVSATSCVGFPDDVLKTNPAVFPPNRYIAGDGTTTVVGPAHATCVAAKGAAKEETMAPAVEVAASTFGGTGRGQAEAPPPTKTLRWAEAGGWHCFTYYLLPNYLTAMVLAILVAVERRAEARKHAEKWESTRLRGKTAAGCRVALAVLGAGGRGGGRGEERGRRGSGSGSSSEGGWGGGASLVVGKWSRGGRGRNFWGGRYGRVASVWVQLAMVVGMVGGWGWSVEAAECTDKRVCCNLVIPKLDKKTMRIDSTVCNQGSSMLSRSPEINYPSPAGSPWENFFKS